MKGFILGILVAGLAAAGYVYWQRSHPASPTAALVPDGGPAAKKTRKRRGAARVATANPIPEGASAEPVHLSPADLRPLAQGDDLAAPDVLRFDMANERQLPELTQDQIDEVFRAQEPAILACIGHARPDPETYVPGRVTVKFRIQRTGSVRGVRVEAPAVLQKNGLFGCIKGAVGRMRFPAAGNSQIASYPFTLS